MLSSSRTGASFCVNRLCSRIFILGEPPITDILAAACLLSPSLQAQAFDLVSTVASAAEGYPFVPPSWAPSVFVPLTGLLLPGLAMATLFVYIEKEA